MAQFLISGPGTLQRLAAKPPDTKPIVAAVAYATRDDHLLLGAGDDIIVNASLSNVLTGATDPFPDREVAEAGSFREQP